MMDGLALPTPRAMNPSMGLDRRHPGDRHPWSGHPEAILLNSYITEN